jgi:hypothetical protein
MSGGGRDPHHLNHCYTKRFYIRQLSSTNASRRVRKLPLTWSCLYRSWYTFQQTALNVRIPPQSRPRPPWYKVSLKWCFALSRSLRLIEHISLPNLPKSELSFKAGFELCGERFLHKLVFSISATLPHRGLVGIEEKRFMFGDTGTSFYENFGDSDGVVEAPW